MAIAIVVMMYGDVQAWNPPDPVHNRSDFAAVVEAKHASVGQRSILIGLFAVEDQF